MLDLVVRKKVTIGP